MNYNIFDDYDRGDIIRMNEKIYTIVLADGTSLTSIHMDGTTLISREEISEKTFVDNLTSVTFTDGENTLEFENLALNYVREEMVDDHYEYWFSFRRISEDEMEKARIWAAIDFVAMMSDVEL